MVTTVGKVWAIGFSSTVIGTVSAGEIATIMVTGRKPIFWILTMLPSSGRNTRLTVPVLLVSAEVWDSKSTTSTASIGSPVVALKTPSTRPRYEGRLPGDCDCACETLNNAEQRSQCGTEQSRPSHFSRVHMRMTPQDDPVMLYSTGMVAAPL